MNGLLGKGGSSVEGRIERIQIMREDGTIREDRKVNIHNTIVNTGLDNILSIGGFDANGVSEHTLDISNENQRAYDEGLWIRMTWFTAIGTGESANGTTYNMTDLVSPYLDSSGNKYSSSHYIPGTADKSIRGTTADSYIAGDIRSTHRVTNNSLKVTEDNVTIKEVGFFCAISTTFSTAFGSQSWNVGDMFSRIELGENSVTLNTGERMVITYAITEYACASSHQAIDSIGLVDGNGDPITVDDGEGNSYPLGAIARTSFCDGYGGTVIDFLAYPNQNVNYLSGGFHGIRDTSESGFITPSSTGNKGGGSFSHWYHLRSYSSYSNSVAMSQQSGYQTTYFNYLSCGFMAQNGNINVLDGWNTNDSYGFPNINATSNKKSSSILTLFAYGSDYDSTNGTYKYFGKCKNNASNPVPYNNYISGRDSTAMPTPTLTSYTRGTFYRDQEWVVPTYYPDPRTGYGSNSVLSVSSANPASVSNIYWLWIRNMIYKFGYFVEQGNLSTFVSAPIVKKAGQVIRFTLREGITRHQANT